MVDPQFADAARRRSTGYHIRNPASSMKIIVARRRSALLALDATLAGSSLWRPGF
jgi:hypothetical protein